MSNTIVAVYENAAIAHTVLKDLQKHGFDAATMGLMTKDSASFRRKSGEISVANGRDFGAFVGGFTGLVLGLITITVPGIGPIIAGGPLAALLGGATGTAIGAGALTGGLSAALVEMNVPQDKAYRYADDVLQGYALVTVGVTEATVDQGIHIMSHYTPVDIQYRAVPRLNNVLEPDPDETDDMRADLDDTEQLVRDNNPKRAKLE